MIWNFLPHASTIKGNVIDVDFAFYQGSQYLLLDAVCIFQSPTHFFK